MSARRKKAMFRANALEDRKRFKKGPVCALCVQTPFTKQDLPEVGTFEGEATYHHCLARDLQVTPGSGRRCSMFQRKR